jgi:tRNA nucleotidyltransferase (CCA-adding enzyme)
LQTLLSDNVRKRILAKVTPTQKELDLQKTIIDSLKQALSDHPRSKEYSYSFIEAQGSTGRKQTQLRGAADIDLFVGLKPEDYTAILEKPHKKKHYDLDHLMASMVKDWFVPAVSGLNATNVQRAFSQHPYLSLKMMNLEIDILGCFDIDSVTLSNSGPITAVDRTVHHTNYVADLLTDEKRDDARILKSFVRASHAYGDQCAVGRMGITGVFLELLAILSETLDDAFDALEQLDSNPIDPLERSLVELRKNPSFRDDYIILIDPTDHQRNIASSFTPRAYEWVKYRIGRLREESRKSSENVVSEIMLESSISTEVLPEWLTRHAFTREFKSDGSKHYTILRDKLYRVAKKVQVSLQAERTGESRFGETLVEVYFEEDIFSIGLLVESPDISEDFIRRGPPIDLVEAADEFTKSHPNVEAMDGFLWTTEERQWRDPQKLVDKVLEDNPIQGLERVFTTGIVSQRVLNVLYRYILPIESSFLEKMTRVKDGNLEIPR